MESHGFARRRLVAQGAKRAATPREVAAASEVIFTIVSDPAGAGVGSVGRDRRVCGIAPGQRADRIEHGHARSGKARRAAAAALQGAEFLEAPVTGGTWGAEKGELVFMVGGEARTLKRVEPVLGVMGKKLFHLGPRRRGANRKARNESAARASKWRHLPKRWRWSRARELPEKNLSK